METLQRLPRRCRGRSQGVAAVTPRGTRDPRGTRGTRDNRDVQTENGSVQYLAALLWIMFIHATIREAYRRHCVCGGLDELLRRLNAVRKGMSKRQVKQILGAPLRVRYDRDRLNWQYLVGHDYRSIEFFKGRVCAVSAPAHSAHPAA